MRSAPRAWTASTPSSTRSPARRPCSSVPPCRPGRSRSWSSGSAKRWAGSASTAAILAGSAPPLDVLGRRIEVLRPGTASAFAPPEIAMAMLASGPFEAPQALEVLREAAIAISRANFYESPMEVDGLALILMHGFGPVPFVYQPPASVPPIASRWAAAVPIGLAFPWFLWQYFWIQQTYERYVKAHPGHYYGP